MRPLRVLGPLLILGVPSCSSTGTAGAREADLGRAAALSSRSDELNEYEAPAFRGDESGARRFGDSLIIPLADGTTLAVVDDTSAVDNWVRYAYRGKVARTTLLQVDVGYYEGGSWLLIDPKNGKRHSVDAAPLPSPDGRFLAVASMDMEAAYDPTRLTIYGLTPDTILQLWRVDSIPWGPDSIAWHGNDSLMVTQAFPTDSGPGYYSYRTAWVLRRGEHWHLEPQ